MSFKNLMSFVTKMEMIGEEKSPTIFTALGLAGLGISVYSAYKAGIKIDKIVKEKKEDLKDVDPEDKDTKRQVTKEMAMGIAKEAAPVVVSTFATGFCIISAHKISAKRIAVLSAAYAISEGKLKDLSEKNIEILGEKKARSIKDAVVKDKMKKKDPGCPERRDVYMTGRGDVLCMDLYTGKEFYSSYNKIESAINRLSADVVQENYVSLNDLFEHLELNFRPQMGDDFGWNVEDLVRGMLPITISAQVTDDGLPILCLDYDISPRADYRNLH